MNCNPFTLSELYLDGCDQLSDEAFDCLVLSEAEIALEDKDPAIIEEKVEAEKLMETLLSKEQETVAVNAVDAGTGED